MTDLKGYTPPARDAGPPASVELAHREVNVATASGREYMQGTTSLTRFSSEESWKNYRRIGEVHYSISRSARIAGYARLKAVRVDGSGDITRESDSGVVAQIVRDIYSPFGGVRGLIERFYTLMKVPGEAWLIDIVEDGAPQDGYWFLSPSEVQQESVAPDQAASKPIKWRTARRETATGSKTAFERSVAAENVHGRVWSADHEFVDKVDSPMNALNDMCDMLDMMTKNIKGRLRQRFTLAGILLIPNEIGDAAISGTSPSKNLYSDDKVMNYLIHVMTRNITRHEEAIAQIPALLKGPADVLDKVRHIILDSMIAETDLKLRGELIGRILDGLDQNKAAATGMEDLNHFGAWQQSDEERRVAVQPDLEALCHCLTRMILWKKLKERGWEDNRIWPWRVWFDLSEASVKSNIAEDARQMWDRGAVGHDFLRKTGGAKESDRMESDEYVRWAGIKTQNPVLMLHGLEEGSVAVDWDRAERWGKKPGPGAESEGDPPEVGPGSGQPGSPDDRDSDTPKSQEPS